MGLRDWNDLSWVHSLFIDVADDHNRPRPPRHELQQSTLAMVRELVAEGLVILGIPNPSKTGPGRFDAWNLPLDEAMAAIEHAYIDNFDDFDSWRTMVWLELTDKGRTLAHQVAEAP